MDRAGLWKLPPSQPTWKSLRDSHSYHSPWKTLRVFHTTHSSDDDYMCKGDISNEV